jgi:hypothetical protein
MDNNKQLPPPTNSMYDNINQNLIQHINPSVIIIIGIVTIAYIVVFMYLGKSDTATDSESGASTGSGSTYLIVFVFIILFLAFIISKSVSYFYGYDITASLKNIFTPKPEVDIYVKKEPIPPQPSPNPGPKPGPPVSKEQVFNIPGNYYSYPDAKSLCSAYGARLATYSEMEDAYSKGAEWCNYGWSDGQMALFPTQKKTYDNLQKVEGHEHDCGRQGVNGGYIANPAVKFGVNCYGKKPPMTEEEEQLMNTDSPHPKTEKDIWMDKRVDYWKERLNDILVSPFNYESWNKV